MKQIKLHVGFQFYNSAGSGLEIVSIKHDTVFYKYMKSNGNDVYNIQMDKLQDHLRMEFYTPISSINYEDAELTVPYVERKVSLKTMPVHKRRQFFKKLEGLGYRWQRSNDLYFKEQAIYLFLDPDGNVTYSINQNTFENNSYRRILRTAFKQPIIKNQNNETITEVTTTEHRESKGTAVKGSCEKNRITSASRLTGNSIQSGRVKGKARSITLKGRLFAG